MMCWLIVLNIKNNNSNKEYVLCCIVIVLVNYPAQIEDFDGASFESNGSQDFLLQIRD